MNSLLNLIVSRSTLKVHRRGTILKAEGTGLWGVLLSALLFWRFTKRPDPNERAPPKP